MVRVRPAIVMVGSVILDLMLSHTKSAALGYLAIIHLFCRVSIPA